MLHPSYTDLMNIANSEVEQGEQPVVNSRYSIVLATAKRARQLIAGSQPLVEEKNTSCQKPLSVAIDELSSSAIKIDAGEEHEEENKEEPIEEQQEEQQEEEQREEQEEEQKPD